MPKTYQELQDERASKLSQAQGILKYAETQDSRPLSADERETVNTLVAEVNKLDLEMQALQATEDLTTQITNLGKGQGRRTSPDPIGRQQFNDDPPKAQNYIRYGRMRNFRGADAEKRAYRSGMWLRAKLFGDRSADQWCQRNGIYQEIQNALGTTPNTSGGFLVPEEFSQAVIDLREEYGVFRQNVRVWPMASDTVLIPRRLTGVSAAFVGENPSAAPSETEPTWNQVRLTAKKTMTLTRLSTEIAEDAAIDLADTLAGEIAYAFALQEDQCGFTGDGTSTYGGIRGLTNLLTLAGGLTGAVVAATATHDTFSEIDATDLVKVMSVLPMYARRNAKWYCSSVAYDLVFGRLMAAAGGNAIGDMERGYSPRFLGYPVAISQVLPAGAATDYSNVAMLLLGDLMLSSTMGNRRGVEVMPSEHRYFELDQIGIKGTQRFDIVNHDVGTTSAAGPMVALVGGAS